MSAPTRFVAHFVSQDRRSDRIAAPLFTMCRLLLACRVVAPEGSTLTRSERRGCRGSCPVPGQPLKQPGTRAEERDWNTRSGGL
jgi:hypothetical protein